MGRIGAYVAMDRGELEEVSKWRIRRAAELVGLASMDRMMGDFALAIDKLMQASAVLDGDEDRGPSAGIPAAALALNYPPVCQAAAAVFEAIGNVELEQGRMDTPKARRMDDLFSEQLGREARLQVEYLTAARDELIALGKWDERALTMARERAAVYGRLEAIMEQDGVSLGPIRNDRKEQDRQEAMDRATRAMRGDGRPESRRERRARERVEAKRVRRVRV